MFRYPFRLPFNHPFREAFSIPGFGEPIPPVSDELLVWLKGNDDGTDLKLDSHLKPDAENFKILQSACTSLNGTGEFGTFSRTITITGDFEIFLELDVDVSDQRFLDGPNDYLRFNGSVWVVKLGGVSFTFPSMTFMGNRIAYKRVGSTHTLIVDEESEVLTGKTTNDFLIQRWGTLTASIAGKAYNLGLKDATQDYHFRCAENSGLTLYSSNYLVDGMYITMTANPVTLWAQRQDTYAGNCIDGWWEITGDPVMYPYPVVGFDVYHKGGTFNDCESSFAPEGFSIGSPNGVDHTITMLSDHGAIVSQGSLDTSVPTYVHPTITFTAGTIRDILFSDGTFMQLREGEGSNLYGTDDVLIGTLNGDSAAWWAGAYQVAQSIIDAEAVQSSAILTDGDGHPEPRTQTWLEANLNVNEQYYITKCDGKNIEVWLYERLMNATEDFEILVASCNAEGVGVNNVQVGVNGVPVGVRI